MCGLALRQAQGADLRLALRQAQGAGEEGAGDEGDGGVEVPQELFSTVIVFENGGANRKGLPEGQ